MINVQGVEYGVLFLTPHSDSFDDKLFFYNIWLFFHTDCHSASGPGFEDCRCN